MLIKVLLIDNIPNYDNLYSSIVISLKNIFYQKIESFSAEEIFLYSKNLLQILLIKSKINVNSNKPFISNIIKDVISNLVSSDKNIQNKDYIKQLFAAIYEYFINESKEYFLKTGKIIIELCTSLLSSKSADSVNYEYLINSYYIQIIDITFANAPNYLDPKNNIYNEEFICLLKNLFQGFYTNLKKLKEVVKEEKMNDILQKFCREYGEYSFELIQLNPIFEGHTTQKFGI